MLEMNSSEANGSQRTPVIHVVIYASLLAALIGSFMPWARVLFITVNGTDGDGIFTAITSLLALICFYSLSRTTGKTSVLKTVTFLSTIICAAIYVYDFINISSVASADDDEFFEVTVTPQLGLILGALGAVVGAIALGKLLFWKPKLIEIDES